MNGNACKARKDGLETAIDLIERKGKNEGLPALKARKNELDDLINGGDQ